MQILTVHAIATYAYLPDARAHNYTFTYTVDVKLPYADKKKLSSAGLIGNELALFQNLKRLKSSIEEDLVVMVQRAVEYIETIYLF